MSEPLLSGLLALYPAQFRREYGAECARLLRDRFRDERGVMARMRLCADVLHDLLFGVPQLYALPRRAFAKAAPAQADGTMIRVADEARLSLGALMCAVALSTGAFGCMMSWFANVRYACEAGFLRQAQTQPPVKKSHQSSMRLASFYMMQQPASAPAASMAPSVRDATSAMVDAINTHKIVMFGETHANKQEYAWLCSLVRDPAFHARVDDIVVEFGNSLYQKSVDRWIAGEDVPMAQVEKAWRNIVGAVGPVSPVYAEFYQAVRESNRMSGSHKVRLLLGDPYADWEKIKDKEDLGPFVAHRDEWYAQVVEDDVLAKGHRALLIMGAGHFRRANGPELIEQKLRALGADPYLVVFGTNVVGAYDDVDPRFDSWKTPAIVALAGNWVGDLPAIPVLTGGMGQASSLKMAAAADAMLYVGPRDSLTTVNVPASELENSDYGKEINRRLMIQMGRTMTFTLPAETPEFQRPAPQQAAAGNVQRFPQAQAPKSMHDPLPPRPPSQ
ncbi:MAG TPA: hypothetical protein VN776_06500 [Terracidiphilus sp.]|nr:hypothetical protein [Terracidiphilus sp.]